MNIPFKKSVRQKMIEEKHDEYLRSQILEAYLIEKIEEGEKDKRNNLLGVQRVIKELESQLKFLRQ